MMPTASQRCPICGAVPKMHEAKFPGNVAPVWVLSCVGAKHNVTIFNVGGPDETIAEWDRRLDARAQ